MTDGGLPDHCNGHAGAVKVRRQVVDRGEVAGNQKMVSADVGGKPRHWTNAWLRMKIIQPAHAQHLRRKSCWKRQVSSVREMLLAINRVIVKLSLQCVLDLAHASAERNLVSVT
jgi:hypothetical protein